MAKATLGALALAIPVCLSGAEFNDRWQKQFAMAATADRRLIIENISGHIRVTGDGANDVRVTVQEHWRADTQEALVQARHDVKLLTEQTGGTVRLFLDGPFRDRGRNPEWRFSHDELNFRHDFDVLVPRGIALELRTVNGREIAVSGTSGEFRLNNVNGSISMDNVAGWGTAKTINGGVRVLFERNPLRTSRFETLNGTIDVAFRSGLDAILRLSTTHGDAYTDFDVVPVTSPVAVERSPDGKRYRIDSARSVRVGSGAIEHHFKTMNGTIKIRKNDK